VVEAPNPTEAATVPHQQEVAIRGLVRLARNLQGPGGQVPIDKVWARPISQALQVLTGQHPMVRIPQHGLSPLLAAVAASTSAAVAIEARNRNQQAPGLSTRNGNLLDHTTISLKSTRV